MNKFSMASQDLVDKFYELTKKFGSKEKAKKFIYTNDIVGDIAKVQIKSS